MLTEALDEKKTHPGNKTRKAKRVGIALLILSTLCYVVALGIVPFLSLKAESKLLVGGMLAVAGEAAFWIGAFLIGKELAKKYRAYLNPLRWLKRDDASS